MDANGFRDEDKGRETEAPWCEVCEDAEGTLCPVCATVLCPSCSATPEHADLHGLYEERRPTAGESATDQTARLMREKEGRSW